jgi:hypothetical protein
MRNAPLAGTRRRDDGSDLGFAQNDLFLRPGLDHPNQLEKPQEISGLAHAL